MWTETLWPGGMSNSDYNTEAVYVEEEHTSQKLDKINDEIIPFTNIYGKGYWAKHVAWKHGKQRVMQPDFAKSDEQLSGANTLHSACVVTDRDGNERDVNVSKRARCISREFMSQMGVICFNKA